ncbi:LuxR C-terminal-related transcriptional regulator [Brevibacillus sp. HD3.3A]|uniref:LuxR C-terminal-related transcriptional regulator n=1 Tax=Brevibacillus sp. HD3.3A TaxID=2738979 RepID=UPI001E318665|nr:LuxR C-terminal-related transcriptional regulator [Brevibacillus sp. HD3.3A]UED72140.1 LuxR C-terminal-related transcriptional regulator [Brevibacillus sp. HD3.3A]
MAASTTMSKDLLIEKVCEKCPATCWGKKAHCQVHDLHVGKIDSCPEWDKYALEQQGLIEQNGQLAFTTIEPAMEWVQKAEEVIKGYRYMLNRAAWLKDELNRAISDSPPGSRLVAQYGIEATLPKAQGTKPTSLNIPEELYERKVKRLTDLEIKIKEAEHAAEQIVDPQEKAVLECLMDGERMNMIALIVGVSRQRVHEIRKSIVQKLAWALYSIQNG